MRANGSASEWLYAIGDVNGRALLTHMGKYQARIAADVILGHGAACLPTTADGSRSPRVIFTDPHVAAVGYTLDAAERDGLNVRAVDVSTQGNAGASFYGRDDARGTTRLVVDDDRNTIVGATFTGPEVAEFLHAATIAVVGEVPLDRLFHAVPAFPTRSEVWLYLLEALGVAGPAAGLPAPSGVRFRHGCRRRGRARKGGAPPPAAPGGTGPPRSRPDPQPGPRARPPGGGRRARAVRHRGARRHRGLLRGRRRRRVRRGRRARQRGRAQADGRLRRRGEADRRRTEERDRPLRDGERDPGATARRSGPSRCGPTTRRSATPTRRSSRAA